MLTPTELKSKQFSKSVFGGYSMQEVDSFLDLVTPDYEVLYSENAELSKKVEILLERLETSQEQEESIKAAIINAQKMCDSIIREAQQSGELIIKSAKNQAEKIRDKAEQAVQDKIVQFEAMQSEVEHFKTALVEAYRTHLQQINSIPSVTGRLTPEELAAEGNPVATPIAATEAAQVSMPREAEPRTAPKEPMQQPAATPTNAPEAVEMEDMISPHEKVRVEQFKVTLPVDLQQEIEAEKKSPFAFVPEMEDNAPTGEFDLGKTMVFENNKEPKVEDVQEYRRSFDGEQAMAVDMIAGGGGNSRVIDEDESGHIYDTNEDILQKDYGASLQFGEKFARGSGDKPKAKPKGRFFR